MTDSKSFYAYVYRDPITNIPFYVGKGNKKRAYVHLSRTDNNLLPNKLRKMKRMGIIPDIEIIPALDEQHAFFLEECLISVFGRMNIDTGSLLNLTDGGEGVSGRIVSEADRKRHSQAITGKRHTVETKQKMSEAHKLLVKTDTHKQNISLAKKGQTPALTTIEAVKKANTGRVPTAENRQLLSDLAKKRGRTAQHNDALRKAHLGKKRSEETKAKMKAAWVKRKERELDQQRNTDPTL